MESIANGLIKARCWRAFLNYCGGQKAHWHSPLWLGAISHGSHRSGELTEHPTVLLPRQTSVSFADTLNTGIYTEKLTWDTYIFECQIKSILQRMRGIWRGCKYRIQFLLYLASSPVLRWGIWPFIKALVQSQWSTPGAHSLKTHKYGTLFQIWSWICPSEQLQTFLRVSEDRCLQKKQWAPRHPLHPPLPSPSKDSNRIS